MGKKRRSSHAVVLGRKASAKLTPDERHALAVKGALARWGPPRPKTVPEDREAR